MSLQLIIKGVEYGRGADPTMGGSEVGTVPVTWRLGVDVGERSIGLAAVSYEEDKPKEILAAVSWIHDGGVGDERSGASRLALRGMARRARRLRRFRRARLRDLDMLLSELGWTPLPDKNVSPVDAWLARKRLAEEYVVDETERRRLLGYAVSHMARHRGWRNPWTTIKDLKNLPQPSDSWERTRESLEARYSVSLEPGTVGQWAGYLLQRAPGIRLNPTQQSAGRRAELSNATAFETRLRQEDVLWELRCIADVQGLPEDVVSNVIDAVFCQKRPSVPAERIGRDPLDPSQLRASRACLEFQEYRIVAAVANLRIRDGSGSRPLSLEERNAVIEALLAQTERSLTWSDIALEILKLPNESDLTSVPEEDGPSSLAYSQFAPFDETSARIAEFIAKNRRKIPTFAQWWQEQDRTSRSDLVAALADNSIAGEEEQELLVHLPDAELEALEGLALPSGRVAYSRLTLSGLTRVMRDDGVDVHNARKTCFGVDDNWRPPLPALHEATGHPVVDRNLAILRKFLSSATMRWGPPQSIVVELARGASESRERQAEEEAARRAHRKANDRIRAELRASGLSDPSPADLVRARLLELYDCHCMYCGAPISWENSELDHIVPRTDGGSNRHENLAITCGACNKEKGRRPFASWAETSNRVQLRDVIDRVQKLKYSGNMYWTRDEFSRYKKSVVARLKRRTSDPEVIQSIESTGYAAVALRDRLLSYGEKNGVAQVAVFRGGVTAEARRWLDISIERLFSRVAIFAQSTSTKRLDRRHHAVDAVVLTTLTPGVAKTLADARSRRVSAEFWRRPSDVNRHSTEEPQSPAYRQWKESCSGLGDLLISTAARDSIAVAAPLRLRPTGALHEETLRAFSEHTVGAAWKGAELRRIVEPEVYAAFLALTDPGGRFLKVSPSEDVLPADENRHIVLSDRVLGPRDRVKLFPDDRGSIRVRGGAAYIASFHHARVFRWGSSHSPSFALLRVSLADLAVAGLLRDGVDVFTAELPPWTPAWRYASIALVKAVESGDAKQVGWLVPGDELDFGPEGVTTAAGDLSMFLKYFPERHWVVTGFEDDKRINLKPAFLSAEQAEVLRTERSDRPDTLTEAGEILAQFFPRCWRATVAKVLCHPGLTVIRRTALGQPRWRRGHLPYSWRPWSADPWSGGTP
ncbi:type II CRISPR RNA-guided endonuclease Cas9 [Acidothermus cellulolyticus]|nr:type II CRISPR RNA-guided endonuclease Cas9 [Acidothermus cellulolyticus]